MVLSHIGCRVKENEYGLNRQVLIMISELEYQWRHLMNAVSNRKDRYTYLITCVGRGGIVLKISMILDVVIQLSIKKTDPPVDLHLFYMEMIFERTIERYQYLVKTQL